MADQALQLAAEALVLRARQGDQNAMGMITQVKQAASRGVARCKESLAAISAYIKANPADDQSDFGAESKLPKITTAALKMARGPLLTDAYIRELGTNFGSDEEEHLFLDTVGNFRSLPSPKTIPPEDLKLMKVSYDIGVARSLQAVRQKGSKISKYSPMAGWELGE